MVKSVVFAVPGDLATPTGGYAYDRRMIAELAGLGWRTEVIALGEGFPRPSGETRTAAMARLSAVPSERPLIIDGLALGVLPEIAHLCPRHKLVALVHHPLALECGLSDAEAAALRRSEHSALACAARVVVTSATMARLLSADYDVPADRITIARPGSDPAPAARGSSDGTVCLLAVGTVVPRKGYDVLVAALAMLADLPWRLTIVGERQRDPAAAARLNADIAQTGLGERIAVLGSVPAERLGELYAAADLFVLPSRFEGYGMAFAEAIARGLPVVGTTTGAIPETVPLDAGVLVPPDDARALAVALRRLIENPGGRRCLASAARSAAARLPTWRQSAELFSQAIKTVS